MKFRAAMKTGKKLRDRKARSAEMLRCNQCKITYPGLCEAPSCKNKVDCDRHHFPRAECFSAYSQAADRGIELSIARELLSNNMACALRMLMDASRFWKRYSGVATIGNFLGVCVLPSAIAARNSDKLASLEMALALQSIEHVTNSLPGDDAAQGAFADLFAVCAYEASTKDGKMKPWAVLQEGLNRMRETGAEFSPEAISRGSLG